jgi:hypothetical protein
MVERLVVYSVSLVFAEIKKTRGVLTMSCLDHLLPFIDNGGRRSYVERRRNSKLARIPERRTGKERRIIYDRRKTLPYENAYGLRAQNGNR